VTADELAKEKKKAKQDAQAEKIRRAICDYCEQHGFPAPVQEHEFYAVRGWKFDYAWPELGIALEVEGGAAIGGRHTSVGGFEADIAKYNEAAIRGWLVLRCLTSKARSARTLGLLWRAMLARGVRAKS